MKNLLSLILLVFASLSLGSCVTEEEFANTPEGNFEALWKIVDEHYCFFDYKQKEYGLDWNKIHDKYADYITPSMTSKNLLDV
ncbi:MAG: peptidase S41, partial [Paludibacteraceae bacterium]|nr:peptidase S41 [Paludibacteraceae bacterium]